jgi:hypothetical protein
MIPYEEDDMAALLIAQVNVATDDTDSNGLTGRRDEVIFPPNEEHKRILALSMTEKRSALTPGYRIGNCQEYLTRYHLGWRTECFCTRQTEGPSTLRSFELPCTTFQVHLLTFIGAPKQFSQQFSLDIEHYSWAWQQAEFLQRKCQ